MKHKIRECMAEAEDARERASRATGDTQHHWLAIAEAWEELAAEYLRLSGQSSNGASQV